MGQTLRKIVKLSRQKTRDILLRAHRIRLMPYSEIIRELEARRKELQAESDALEARLEALKDMQAKVGVRDDTRIIAAADVVKETQPA